VRTSLAVVPWRDKPSGRSLNDRFAPEAVVRREHVTFNHGVEGSSPSALTNKNPCGTGTS
jgi:hypothetical protein